MHEDPRQQVCNELSDMGDMHEAGVKLKLHLPAVQKDECFIL